MRLYEGLFLVDSNVAAKDWSGIEKHILDLLAKQKVQIEHTEKWPDRRLAYEIKGCKKGTYFLVYFNAEPGAIDEVKRDVALSERILRVLFICEPGLDEEMERRKNKEIGAPPADLFDDRRGFRASRDRDRGRDRPPRERPARAPEAGAPAGESSTAVAVDETAKSEAETKDKAEDSKE